MNTGRQAVGSEDVCCGRGKHEIANQTTDKWDRRSRVASRDMTPSARVMALISLLALHNNLHLFVFPPAREPASQLASRPASRHSGRSHCHRLSGDRSPRSRTEPPPSLNAASAGWRRCTRSLRTDCCKSHPGSKRGARN
ncbi:Hypothetical predicted protein, partial [Olea europaea subsp. europaea]